MFTSLWRGLSFVRFVHHQPKKSPKHVPFSKQRRFIDKKRIRLKAGDGGNGSISFFRGANRARGPPDGGDGGKGGSVYLQCSTAASLSKLTSPSYRATNGQPGRSRNVQGANGEDVYLTVPAGTIIKLLGKDQKVEKVIGDLDRDGAKLLIAKGGRGGQGNSHFASGEVRSPKVKTLGEAGDKLHVELELKLIADVGLVGYPNAGKSTLLAAISQATPRIAPYAFTTLHPNLGVVTYEDFFQLRVADLPGLIDGASEDRGLGLSFLRHIERTKLICFVVDSTGMEGRPPLEDFESVVHELECYESGLALRPSIFVANKIDLLSNPEAKMMKFVRYFDQVNGAPEGYTYFLREKRLTEGICYIRTPELNEIEEDSIYYEKDEDEDSTSDEDDEKNWPLHDHSVLALIGVSAMKGGEQMRGVVEAMRGLLDVQEETSKLDEEDLDINGLARRVYTRISSPKFCWVAISPGERTQMYKPPADDD